MYLESAEHGTEPPVRYKLEGPPAAGGEHAMARVGRDRAGGTGTEWSSAPLGTAFGLMGVGFLGIGIASLATGSKDTRTETSGGVSVGGDKGRVDTRTTSTTTDTAASLASIGVGLGASAISIACWVWFGRARDGGVNFLRDPASRQTMTLGPGLLSGAF